MLTSRQQHIATKLLNSQDTIRIQDLSNDLGVSTRTIKYDLDTVKAWLTEQNAMYYSQRNRGIGVQCEESQRIILKTKIQKLGKEATFKNQHQRVKHFIIRIINSDSYTTAQDLADDLDVSRNTVLNDLTHVESYLEKWNVTLERKPRQGYRIIGEELYIRLLLQRLIFQNISNHDVQYITQYIKGIEQNEEDSFQLDEPLHTNMKRTLEIMSSLADNQSIERISSQELLIIVIRLTISITRMKMGKSLSSYRILNESNWQDFKKRIVIESMKRLCNDLSFPVLEEEFLYVEDQMKTSWNDCDIVFATQQMIKYVSTKEKQNYVDDPTLFTNLLLHLSSRLQEGTSYVMEENPFKGEIISSNSPLCQTIFQAAMKHLSPHGIIIHETFITLIALHFMASNERKTPKQERIQALYVCSTGRGVARIIKNKVEREMKEINIVAHCSIKEVEKICAQQKVDVIISVFPIDSDKPVIIVEPTLSQNDLDQIRSFIEKKTGIPCQAKMEQQLLTTSPISASAESISEDIIVKGFQITQELIALLGDSLKEERKQAFMMHVFLMIHRFYFQKQYDYFQMYPNEAYGSQTLLLSSIKQLISSHNITLNHSEIDALLQYIR